MGKRAVLFSTMTKKNKEADEIFIDMIETSIQKGKDWLREEEFDEIITRKPIFD